MVELTVTDPSASDSFDRQCGERWTQLGYDVQGHLTEAIA
jgi:hypothetical protein